LQQQNKIKTPAAFLMQQEFSFNMDRISFWFFRPLPFQGAVCMFRRALLLRGNVPDGIPYIHVPYGHASV
jgi:hypothetical protein